MQFMRDYPDDATCLEWLWRQRLSLDGEHAQAEARFVHVFGVIEEERSELFGRIGVEGSTDGAQRFGVDALAEFVDVPGAGVAIHVVRADDRAALYRWLESAMRLT